MNHLDSFLIFESVNKAKKIISEKNLKFSHFDRIFTEFQKNGIQNYLGYLLELITSEDSDFHHLQSEDYINDINLPKLIDTFKFIKLNGIDLSKKHYYDVHDLVYNIDELKNQLKFIRFINIWCPSSLRKESKDIANKKKYTSLLEKPSYIDRLENLSDFEKTLIRKSSICKTAEEWFKHINNILNSDKFYLSELKSSNIEIIHEDDNYLVYKPLDYKSYLVPNFRHWCTMIERQFDDYYKMDLIILLNKNEKSKSFIGYSSNNIPKFFDYYNRQFNSTNDLIEIGMRYYKS